MSLVGTDLDRRVVVRFDEDGECCPTRFGIVVVNWFRLLILMFAVEPAKLLRTSSYSDSLTIKLATLLSMNANLFTFPKRAPLMNKFSKMTR